MMENSRHGLDISRDSAELKVCLFGTFEEDYDRNRILRSALESGGAEIVEVHHPLWRQRRYKIFGLRNPLTWIALGLRLLWAHAMLAFRYLLAPAHDVVLVAYPGHADLPLARFLTRLRRKPLVFDAFVSIHDTLTADRQLFSPDSLPGRLSWRLDRMACRLADQVWLDTDAHIDYFVQEFDLEPDRFRRVLVGADETRFTPGQAQHQSDSFRVLFYGKYAPLHGISTILQAAAILKDRPGIQFELVGGGQTRQAMADLADQLGLENVHFVDWIEPDELGAAVLDADLCLGIFGDTPKAGRVIPNKVYQAMASRRAVVTRDGPAARELLEHGRSAWLCPANDAQALAEAITELQTDPGQLAELARGGNLVFNQQASQKSIGSQALEWLGPLKDCGREFGFSRVFRNTAALLFATVIIAFIAVWLRDVDWGIVASLSVDGPLVVWALSVGILSRMALPLVWIILLRGLGCRVGLDPLIWDAYARAWMGRYIPGKVSMLAARVAMSERLGLSTRDTLLSSAAEQVIQLATAAALGLLILTAINQVAWLGMATILLLLVVAVALSLLLLPVTFNRLVGTVLGLMGGQGGAPRLGGSAILYSVAVYLCINALIGYYNTVLLGALTPDHVNFLAVWGAVNVAGALGMVLLLAPSGLGVREVVLLPVFTALTSLEVAVAGVVLVRMADLLLDFLFVGCGVLIRRMTGQ